MAELSPDATFGSVVKASMAEDLDRLVVHVVAIRRGGDDEDIHQARVATRRLRSDLRTFGSALPPGWVADVRVELKWLADAFGAVRDADVMRARIAGHAATASALDAGGYDLLLARLDAEIAAASARLVPVLDSERYAALVQTLEVASAPDDALGPVAGTDRDVASPPDDTLGRVTGTDRVGPLAVSAPREDAGAEHVQRAAQPALEVMGPLVGRPWRKLRKAVRGLGERPSDEQLHRIRVKTKQVRYAAEVADTVADLDDSDRSAVAPFARAAADLQEILGDLHDAVVAEQWLREASKVGTGPEVFISGQCVALERRIQARSRERWPGSWKRLKRAAKPLRGWTR